MEKLTLDEKVVDAALAGGFTITREQFRMIKSFDRAKMTRYVAEVYKNGFVDGLDAVQQAVEENKAAVQASTKKVPEGEDVEEVKVDWEDVLAVIATVKGVTKDMLQSIDSALKETF